MMMLKKSISQLINMQDYFNNPERLYNLFSLKKGCTIFCDIDGTIIEHENVPSYSSGLVLLEGSLEKMNEWYKDNAYVILTTSRNSNYRAELEKALAESNIKYDALVMDIPPGPRYLINDKKPYSEITMAKSFEVKRNEGIKTIGHSFAAVNIKDNTIEKTLPLDANQTNLNKFEWQYKTMSDLLAIPSVSKSIPKVYDFTPHKFHIEFLENHKGIHEFDTYQRNQILPYVMNYLKSIYDIEYIEVDDSKQWLLDFVDAKIYAKMDDFRKYDLDMSIFDDMKDYLENNIHKVTPNSKFARYFHGDSTYENILFNNFDVKFIDFDNDYKMGPIELDMGKLTQSIITKYESWDTPETEITETNDEFNQVLDMYNQILQSEHIKSKAYFYCIIHLIRMVPYQAQRDVNRCKIALSWIKKLFNELQTISD